MRGSEATEVIYARSKLLMNRLYCIYMMSNRNNNVLYTGVTNDLRRRVYEHKTKFIKGFTDKYNVTKLVYYEVFSNPYDAISREKQIKAGPRRNKVNLINNFNREWNDLYKAL